MSKLPDNRTDRLFDNEESNQNPHLSDEHLLLALDGELSAREAACVEVHLEACWSCRARREQIEQAIGDVVEYRNYVSRPYSPLSRGGKSMFVAQLQRMASTIGRPTLWNRILGSLRASRRILDPVIPRQAWISALVMAVFVLFLFSRLWEAPKVSASQLLENAQIFEDRALHNVAKPVVYQKLRIRIGNDAVTRIIYRDPIGKRQADRLDLSGDVGELASYKGLRNRAPDRPEVRRAAEMELRQTFRIAHLNWDDPLSPASYNAWHNGLDQKRDEVIHAGEHLIILRTTTPEGPVAESSITVRTMDFHPVAEDFRLKDNHKVEVSELAWEVMSMEALNPAIFSPELNPVPPVVRPVNLVPPPPPGPTNAELAEAELQARVAIHAEKADLGEQIELDSDIPDFGLTTSQRSVIVRGIVSTAERKNDLIAALGGIPHVELHLQTVEEAAAAQDPSATGDSSGPASGTVQKPLAQETQVTSGSGGTTPHGANGIVASTPALEQQLKQRLPKAEDREAFINKAVELVEDAMAQAWALRRLKDRYTPDTVAELSRGSQQTLELLIRDHVSLLRQNEEAARNMVAPLLPAEPIVAAQIVGVPGTALPGVESTRDWRNAITEIFPEVQKVHDNVATLLAGSGEGASETQTLVDDLRKALGGLDIQLPVLSQQVSEPFLSDQQSAGIR